MVSNHYKILFAVWLCQLWSQTQCSDVPPYSALSPDPVYPSTDGNFTWPRGATTGTFTAGSTMNISWTTTYSNVNLWLIVAESWASPISLVSSYSTPWYEWEVQCGQNCSTPFLLRAVDAGGSDYEQQHGGFYSYQFWIKPTDGTTQTTTVPFTIVSTKADPIPTVLSTSISSSSSSSSSFSSSASAITSVSPAIPSTSTSINTITSTTSSANTNAPAPIHDSGSGTSPTMSISVGIGAGVAAALICLGVFLLWRRRHRKHKDEPARLPQIEMYEQAWQKHHDLMAMYLPSRMTSSSKSTAPVEAPGGQTDPYELPAQSPKELGAVR